MTEKRTEAAGSSWADLSAASIGMYKGAPKRDS